MMCKWTCCLAVSSLLFGAIVSIGAQGPQAARGADGAQEEKTTITSKRMTVKNQESRAIFEGAVVLTHGPLIVHADTMEIYFQSSQESQAGGSTGSTAARPPVVPAPCRPSATSSTPPTRAPKPANTGAAGAGAMPSVSNRAICLMEATGHVVIEKDEGRATSKKAVYHVLDRKIVLTGDPVACQRGTRVSGDTITMYLDDDRSDVDGSSQVMINPEGSRCLP
ncbi:MAG: LptA/OstA family protein [Nitrospiraceae bacterium]